GAVTLERVVVTLNTAVGRTLFTVGTFGAFRGTAGEGGGIYSAGGSLTITASVIANNTAQGGNGAGDPTKTTTPGAPGGAARGGGIFIFGGVRTVSDSQVAGNAATGGAGASRPFSVSGFPSAGSPGGDAQGAGVYAAASTTALSRSVLSGNLGTG